MSSRRFPAIVLSGVALGFLVWGILMVLGPAGPILLEWLILGISVVVLVFGLTSLRSDDGRRAQVIRWLLSGFAVFGAVAVIGLTADHNSSRTWVRLGWAALLAGTFTSVVVWWVAPRVSRRVVLGGGAVALVIIAGGAGITANCDKSLQRSWCDPIYEQEEIVSARIVVDGVLQRRGRAGGDTGARLTAYLIEGTAIEAVTFPPDGFVYEERPIQSTEVTRGRYTAQSGEDANCQIDVKVEVIPAGNMETITVSCTSGR
jgi:hypothetical protein